MDNLVIQSHRGTYEVTFTKEPFTRLGEGEAQRHYIVDRRVGELYRDALTPVLQGTSVLEIEATERNKSLHQFPGYADHLVRHGAQRDHTLVAIGGGILQDITCFLASTLFRGMAWEFHPTTLLAQADSCIGSKSSINVGETKNVMGTFYPPRHITTSSSVLETLDERDLRSGIGEMIKVHVIDGPDSFDSIAAAYQDILSDPATMLYFIRRSLEIKQGYIEKDEFDRGPRNIFNYGHSFGHAIEAATDFAVPHGIAVTLGMDMANFTAVELGRIDSTHFDRMHPLMAENFRGYEETEVPLEPFLAAIAKDKKNIGSDLTLILPNAQARPEKVKVPNDNWFADLCRDYLERVRRV